MKPVLTCFYSVDQQLHSVTVPSTGNAQAEYAEALRRVKAAFPDAKDIVRSGSRIENLEDIPEPVVIAAGQTIRQLFEGTSNVINLGRVTFDETPCDVLLLYSASSGAITPMLKPLVGSVAPIRFSTTLTPQRLANELPAALAEAFGASARDLNLNITRS